ncbi:sugar ABC transporter substrate-binding protein [Zobellella denitrificans]|jgi:inositol transport system substrate-binding protein|uniref:Rhizopine-binding protein n=1 Tax=Zobellella denitrificans TaxID=347534 RepID=A0A291HN37_9GAMM|nr:sugar ABC transporter substrate-binding protein [Zobellella denitrificans]ATG73577.1 rhizopine-binding protein [Zobellella denitrificans]
MKFKKLIVASALASVLPFGAYAEDIKIGVSMALFDDNFLTLVRQAMQEKTAELDGVSAQFEDAKNDVGQQLQQVESFVNQKLDAIVINPVDTQAVAPIIKRAEAAGIPLIFVNRRPEAALPDGMAFVGSDSKVAGRLQMEYIAEKLGGKGNVAILMGELSNEATRDRTSGVEEVAAKYPDIKIIAKETGKWSRKEGIDVTNNWLLSGYEIDAIASNNDEMAIGAIMALGPNRLKDVIVGGVDATPDALAFVDKGMMALTVFQDAKGQGKASIETAVKMAKGEAVDKNVMIPYELVSPENYKEFVGRN